MNDLSAVRVIPPIDQIVQWIIEGNSVPEILDEIPRQFPDSDRDQLYGAALAHIQAAAYAQPDLVRGLNLLSRREIFRRAMEIGDLGTALRALDRIDAMFDK